MNIGEVVQYKGIQGIRRSQDFREQIPNGCSGRTAYFGLCLGSGLRREEGDFLRINSRTMKELGSLSFTL